MGRLAAEGVTAGFLGFTTSRTQNHKTSLGEPTPTLTAAREELVGIAEAIGTTGTGVLQLVSDFTDIDGEFAIVRAMTESSGRPISFTLVESPRGYEYHRAILDHIETARADGLTVTGQTAVRPIGVLLGFECTLNPFLANPVYREVRPPDGGTHRRPARPAFRERLLAAAGGKDMQAVGGRLIEKFDIMFALGESPNYEPNPRIRWRDRCSGRRLPAEVALDALLENDGTAMLWVPFSNFGQGNLDGTHELLSHPYTVPALSDGGAHVGTICDGSFPTTLLQHWGRDRDGARLDLEFLIQRQARDTARLVGLHDRGVLAPGYRADLNVIDFDRLRVHQPELLYDLPAGGRRVVQRADGYRHTIVAGVETYTEGEATGSSRPTRSRCSAWADGLIRGGHHGNGTHRRRGPAARTPRGMASGRCRRSEVWTHRLTATRSPNSKRRWPTLVPTSTTCSTSPKRSSRSTHSCRCSPRSPSS